MELNQMKAELKGRIAKGLNYAIEAVEEVLAPDTDRYNQFVLLKSKYSDLMHYSSINTLPYQELELGFDKLRNNLLQLVNALEPGDFKKDTIAADLKNQALPYRRENFFKLLDLLSQNLNRIHYVGVSYNYNTKQEEEERVTGREAVYQFYRLFRNRSMDKGKDSTDAVRAMFFEYFTTENNGFDVYLKNVRHLLKYIRQDEVEQGFFLDTLQSMLSRYELALIFYYATSGVDPAFYDLSVSAGIFPADLKEYLFNPDHWKELRS